MLTPDSNGFGHSKMAQMVLIVTNDSVFAFQAGKFVIKNSVHFGIKLFENKGHFRYSSTIDPEGEL